MLKLMKIVLVKYAFLHSFDTLSFFYNILLLSSCFTQRYYYYVERGINKSMIAVPDPSIMKNVCGMVPSSLLTNHELDPMIQDLSEEINHDYEYSIRKSIGNILLSVLL
jgi:hypothetical protein